MSQVQYIKGRRKGKHLNFQDRQLIEHVVSEFRPKKVKIKDLKSLIGVSESTIRRELKRGKVILKDSEWNS